MIKSISGLLEDLADSAPSEADPTFALIKSSEPDERAAKVYELKMTGMSVHSIALALDVHISTVYTWIKDHVTKFREHLETQNGADIIAESLLFLGRIEDVCLHEIHLLATDILEMGPDGDTIKVVDNNNSATKNRWLNTVLKTRGMKLDLLQNTGVLPKEAGRIYHSMDEEKRDDTLDKSSRTRSIDQVKQSIVQLVERGRTLEHIDDDDS